MSKEIAHLQTSFDRVFANVMELAQGQVLTGEPLTALQERLGELQHAINEVKRTCEEPPLCRKT
jgi:hypothetical protein